MTDSDRAAPNSESLDQWMQRQLRASLERMASAISATELTYDRSDFFQKMTPVRGSVVASPTTGENVRPDYFFHWLRDSALVINAFALAIERGYEERSAIRHLHDFVAFSLEISRASGPDLLATRGVGRTQRPELARYLRSELELQTVIGDRVFAEARFNPDGSLDILKWARPQFDGPALRALTLLRHLPLFEEDGEKTRLAHELLDADLAFVQRHFPDPCYDIWERRFGHHYHTRVVSLAATAGGAARARKAGREKEASAYSETARALLRMLDSHWSGQGGFYLSAIKSAKTLTDPDLDSAILLAVVNSDLANGCHSFLDPRAQATLERLEDLFASLFPINSAVGPGEAPLLGRFRGDGYYGGGVFLMTALAAAEIYYNLTGHIRTGGFILVEAVNRRFLERCGVLEPSAPESEALPRAESERSSLAEVFRRRGDSIMAALRRFTPPSGELSEQIDKTDGRQASARNLAWSYAAFISAFAAREGSA